MPKVSKINIIIFLFILFLSNDRFAISSDLIKQIPKEIKDFHESSFVIDLHVDPLLWNRDLALESKKGQVDFNKMKKGGVDSAIFGIATEGLPIINGWRLMTWWFDWPKPVRLSKWASAIAQINNFEQYQAKSNNSVVIVKNTNDLSNAISEQKTAIMFGIEGGHAIEGDLSRIKELSSKGVLYMGPLHLNDNNLGGSSFSWRNYEKNKNGGLTDYGKDVVKKMDEVGMWIDVAHLSEASFWDVINISKGAIICSHTGVKGVNNHWRNLNDQQIKAIARRGGIIGILLSPRYLGGKQIDAWIKHVRHIVNVAGIEHVAIGSDFDGFIPLPKGIDDISDTPLLTKALFNAGFSKDDIKKVLGENFISMLKKFRP